jgi:thiaminase (transcriptional activator TenA)
MTYAHLFSFFFIAHTLL